MKLVVTFGARDEVLPIEVGEDMSLADLKAYIEVESQVPAGTQILVHNTQPIEGDDSRTLASVGLTNDDMLVVVERTAQAAPATAQGDITAQFEQMRNQLNSNPALRQSVVQRFPQLEQVLDDPARFQQLMSQLQQQQQQDSTASSELQRQLQQDPDNEENQRRILELIQQEAVAENLQSALEYNPEVFGHITMLFVRVIVNGHEVKAFVDSGAQATIMSPDLAEECGLSHLIDTRFQGLAMGVGTAKILGRIHSAPVKVGDSFFPCSFTVMEGKNVEMLLGLDMLRRYQASIDLKNNVLVFGDTQTEFLPESEVPKIFAEAAQDPNSATGGVPVPAPPTVVPTPQAAPVPVAPARQTVASGQAQPSDADVQQLMGLGFSRDEVLSALQLAGGNVEVAAAHLFG